MKNKFKIIAVLLTFVSIVLLVGLSYAWYQLTITGNNTIKLTTGTLEIDYSDNQDENYINLNNAEPMSDLEGMSTNPYTFTINNKGKLASDYTIYIDDENIDLFATRMPDRYVKYSLDIDGVTTTGTLSNLTIDENNTTTISRILKTGTIDSSKEVVCKLRIWISSDAPNSIMNNILSVKIRIVNTQPLE